MARRSKFYILTQIMLFCIVKSYGYQVISVVVRLYNEKHEISTVFLVFYLPSYSDHPHVL